MMLEKRKVIGVRVCTNGVRVSGLQNWGSS